MAERYTVDLIGEPDKKKIDVINVSVSSTVYIFTKRQ